MALRKHNPARRKRRRKRQMQDPPSSGIPKKWDNKVHSIIIAKELLTLFDLVEIECEITINLSFFRRIHACICFIKTWIDEDIDIPIEFERKSGNSSDLTQTRIQLIVRSDQSLFPFPSLRHTVKMMLTRHVSMFWASKGPVHNGLLLS